MSGKSTEKVLQEWTNLLLKEGKLEDSVKKSNMIDLYLIELTNGEELVCTDYYDLKHDEYRLEVLSPEVCDYDVLKEEVKSIKVIKNCMIKSISEEKSSEINTKEM